MQALAFRDTPFEIVDRDGQPWLRLPQIGAALGYTNPYKVQQVYDRNSDEFTEKMTAVVKLPDLLPQSGVAGQMREVRIFSLRGAHLLAMFARTEAAKEFRRWVLDVLEGIAEVPAKTKRQPKSLPDGLTLDQQTAIKQLVKARVESVPKDKQAKAAITCWSALKSKFGCTYKKIDPEQFAEAASLVARIELEGEFLGKEEPDVPVKASTMLPAAQAKEITDRLDRLSFLFHPFSEQCGDVIGIRRALRGLHPRIGLPQPDYVEVIGRSA